MHTNDEIEQHHGPPNDIWVSVVILVRVAMILAFFLVLFLAIFMGYFTFPLLLIALVTVIYMLSDLGLYMTVRKRKQTRDERVEFLHDYQEKQEHED